MWAWRGREAGNCMQIVNYVMREEIIEFFNKMLCKLKSRGEKFLLIFVWQIIDNFFWRTLIRLG